MINNYPYTDFHEINLDYILKKINDLISDTKEQIDGLYFDTDGNKIVLKDRNNNIISEITAPYANSSNESNSALTAGSADNATNAQSANKDINGKDLVTYIASGAVQHDNSISLFDGAGNLVNNLQIETITPSVIELYAGADSLNLASSALDVSDNTKFYTTDYQTYNDLEDDIENSVKAGVITKLKIYFGDTLTLVLDVNTTCYDGSTQIFAGTCVSLLCRAGTGPVEYQYRTFELSFGSNTNGIFVQFTRRV